MSILEQMSETRHEGTNLITDALTAETVVYSRLTTGQVVVALANLGNHLERAITAYKAIPDAKVKDVELQLRNIIESANAISATAGRLIASNR